MSKKAHRGYGKFYAKAMQRLSRFSYYLFSGGESFSDLLLREIKFERDVVVLDVGCGVGNLLLDINNAMLVSGAKGKVVGIDRSLEMIRIARKKVAVSGKNNFFVVCDAAALPFRNCSFDIAFNVLLLHHLHPEDKVSVLRDLRRVIKDTAQCVLMDIDKPTSTIGKIIGLSRRHVYTIMTNSKYGLRYYFTKAGLKEEIYIKKLGIFSYCKLQKAAPPLSREKVSAET